MEFDNDKLIKRPYRIEIVYWVLLALMNPLVNSLTIFLGDIKMWPVVLTVNLLVLPAYFFFSAWVAPRFLFQNRPAFFVLFSLAFMLLVLAVIYLAYALVQQFPLSGTEINYFAFSYSSVIRECLWAIIHIAMATGIYFIKQALDEKDRLVSLQKDNTYYKLRYLRAQLNPHFLFNTLNSIYSLSLQKSDRTPDVIIRLADIMRYLIDECNEEKIPLAKEVEFIRNYIEMEKIRFNADVRFMVEGDIENRMIEPFLFISFIENGFKHALDNSDIRPFIFVTLKVEPNQIVLNVINNSNASLERQAKKINGKGISNSRSVLELLYPDAYALDIIQTEKEQRKESKVRLKNAKERLETLYPDTHTLDVILSNSTFTVSLIIKTDPLDKVYNSGR